MRTLSLEVRYAIRSILKRPAMSAIVVVTLALGIGANAAVFEMIDALVLRPFTMPDVDRITLLSVQPRRRHPPAGVRVARRLPRHEAAAARRSSSGWRRGSGGTPTWSARTSPRTCRASSCRRTSSPPSASSPLPVATSSPRRKRAASIAASILGHGLWQRRFASDASIVGRSIEVDGAPHEVVGIAPPGFDFPMGTQIWAPLSFAPATAANRRAMYLTARRPARAGADARGGRRHRWRPSASG